MNKTEQINQFHETLKSHGFEKMSEKIKKGEISNFAEAFWYLARKSNRDKTYNYEKYVLVDNACKEFFNN